MVQELVRGLAVADFGNRIVLFGAALLLSVLPMVILLSDFASTRVDDDIARHLGLNGQSSRVIEGLIRPAHGITFNLAIMISLLLSFIGTVAMASSVQAIYERVFGLGHTASARNLLRCVVWVACVAGLLIGDAAVSTPLGGRPAGTLVVGLVDFSAMTLFFWWSMHTLLAARVPWRRLLPAAVTTALFWVGLGVFASFYFAPTIVSDSRLYGTIGIVFTMVSWFIAIGAVITLGAVVGAVWQNRRDRRRRTSAVKG